MCGLCLSILLDCFAKHRYKINELAQKASLMDTLSMPLTAIDFFYRKIAFFFISHQFEHFDYKRTIDNPNETSINEEIAIEEGKRERD